MRIAFYIFYAFGWLLSKLPFRLLYIISDFLYFILYFVVGYRKKVSYENLRKSFPEKNEKWIRATARKYYKNLADLFVETTKLMTISKDKLQKRFKYKNIEIIDEFLKQNKSIIMSIGHCGNWEWMGNTFGPTYPDFKGYAIVKPLNNKYFDGYINGLRSRFSDDSTIYFKETFRQIIKRKDIPTFYVFAADQTPTMSEAGFWGEFFHQETPFFTGIEKIARSLDFGVIFMDIYREKRGHYVGEISIITESAKETEENKITKDYIVKLENAIRKRPDNWLWSHRRWKHSPSNH